MMKNLITFILLLTCSFCFSQEINRFDANGKRHGIWKKNFDDTKVLRYEGRFNHGKEVGIFKFYKNLDNKAVLTATRQFEEDSDLAEVKFFTSTGKVISQGKMKGKLYVGEWKYYHNKNENIMTLENYNNNGELDGLKKVFYKNGQLAEERLYKNGKLEGEAKWYSEKGVLLKDHNYKNNMLDGLAKHYDFKGNIIVEGHYKADKKHGVWKYFEDGKLVRETNFTRKSKNPYKKQG